MAFDDFLRARVRHRFITLSGALLCAAACASESPHNERAPGARDEGAVSEVARAKNAEDDRHGSSAATRPENAQPSGDRAPTPSLRIADLFGRTRQEVAGSWRELSTLGRFVTYEGRIRIHFGRDGRARQVQWFDCPSGADSIRRFREQGFRVSDSARWYHAVDAWSFDGIDGALINRRLNTCTIWPSRLEGDVPS